MVGILASALYNPVWINAVLTPYDFAVAALGFTLLMIWRTPPIAVVLVMTLLSVAPAL